MPIRGGGKSKVVNFSTGKSEVKATSDKMARVQRVGKRLVAAAHDHLTSTLVRKGKLEPGSEVCVRGARGWVEGCEVLAGPLDEHGKLFRASAAESPAAGCHHYKVKGPSGKVVLLARDHIASELDAKVGAWCARRSGGGLCGGCW